jgi:hypothetical protein
MLITVFYLVPWWAEVHVFLGFVLFFWIMTPALYYSNVSLDCSSTPILELMAANSLGNSHTSRYLPMSLTINLGTRTTLPEYSERMIPLMWTHTTTIPRYTFPLRMP